MMKICSSCKHTQAEGNFCGKCGMKLAEQEVIQKEMSYEPEKFESAATQEAPRSIGELETNEQLNEIKEQSRNYLNYFTQQLKTPSTSAIQDPSSFKNNLISIGLYILVTVITVELLISNILRNYFDFGSSFWQVSGPSFSQVVIYTSIFFTLIIGINVLAVFVTSKLFVMNQNFKDVISTLGSYFPIPIVFSVIGILLAALSSFSFATISIYIGTSLAFGIIPLFVMLKLLNTKTKNADSFYAFLFYLVFTFIAGLFLFVLIADSIIGELLSELLSYF